MTVIEQAEDLLQQRKLTAAVVAFERAVSAGQDFPRCAAGLWTAHMLGGDFAAAWRQSDALREQNIPDPHRFWQGESIDGARLMLRCLHGFGDAVQMLRYLPLLRQRCASVTVEVPPRLMQLAPCFAGVDKVITWGEDAPAHPPAWDVQVEVMELPYLFRTTCADLPIATQYLHLPEKLLRDVDALTAGPQKRVGVVWSTGEWNQTRVIPFALIQELTQQGGIDFWNLQGGPEQLEWSTLPPAPHRRNGAEAGDGILPLAALIQQMDFVITADTLAAHLAGALGTPACVVLQYASDWRWMHNRTDSPWYPSLRLFRQEHPGDWSSAMSQVNATLAEWMRHA